LASTVLPLVTLAFGAVVPFPSASIHDIGRAQLLPRRAKRRRRQVAGGNGNAIFSLDLLFGEKSIGLKGSTQVGKNQWKS
jgi:hypothetical protein